MPVNYLDKTQFIKPFGKFEIIKSDKKSIAVQKGLINGRVIKIEISLDTQASSNKKTQKLVTEALKKSSLALQEVDLDENKLAPLRIASDGVIQSSRASASLEKGEIRLTFEEAYQAFPRLSAHAIQTYSPGKLKRIFNRISHIIRNIMTVRGRDEKRNASVALLSGGVSIDGSHNSAAKIVQKTIASGKVEMELRPETPKNFLEAYHDYSKTKRFINWGTFLIKKSKELKKLKEGECLIFPLVSDDHKTIGMVIKEPGGNFTLQVSNSGYGLDNHFHVEEHFQRVLIIKNIPEDKLNEALISYGTSVALHLFIKTELIDELYKKLGTLGESVQDNNPAYWGPPQSGSSCTGEAENILLKANLTDKTFEELTEQLKIHAAFKNFKKIMKGSDTSYSLKLSTLDIVHVLQRGQLNVEMREALGAIETKVIERLNRKKALKLSKSLEEQIFKDFAKIDPESRNPADLIKRALHAIATYQLPEANKILDTLDNLPVPALRNNEEFKLAYTFMGLYAAEKGVSSEILDLYKKGIKVIGKRTGEDVANL